MESATWLHVWYRRLCVRTRALKTLSVNPAVNGYFFESGNQAVKEDVLLLLYAVLKIQRVLNTHQLPICYGHSLYFY